MTALDYRCFFLAYPSGRVFEYEDDEGAKFRCYGSRESALLYAHQGVDDKLGIPMVQQYREPCVTLPCAACGRVYDEDVDGQVHFRDVDEVRKWVPEIGWRLVGPDAFCERCPAPVADQGHGACDGQSALFGEARDG